MIFQVFRLFIGIFTLIWIINFDIQFLIYLFLILADLIIIVVYLLIEKPLRMHSKNIHCFFQFIANFTWRGFINSRGSILRLRLNYIFSTIHMFYIAPLLVWTHFSLTILKLSIWWPSVLFLRNKRFLTLRDVKICTRFKVLWSSELAYFFTLSFCGRIHVWKVSVTRFLQTATSISHYLIHCLISKGLIILECIRVLVVYIVKQEHPTSLITLIYFLRRHYFPHWKSEIIWCQSSWPTIQMLC